VYEKISSKIARQKWCARDPRYVRLDNYDRLIDGTFYQHLQYAFYDETTHGGEPVPIDERRPSAQFRLCRWVARWSIRKLFAGRHAPKIVHPDPKTARTVRTLARSCRLIQTMAQAAFLGSVGSVGITFRVDEDQRVSLAVWRSRFLEPKFDKNGELASLRLQYQASGSALAAIGAPLRRDRNTPPHTPTPEDLQSVWWFIRDYLPDKEVTYLPVRGEDWNPVDGFTRSEDQNRELEPWPEEVYPHRLGFVPAVWVVNLLGGEPPDGCATFEDAIPNAIDLDFTLSQLGRGVRYNAAPQLTVIGEIRNAQVVRGPMSYLHLEPAHKTEDGETLGAGSATLLEMNGSAIVAGIQLLEFERNLALESIAASRKDPEKMRGMLSARAMEFLEEDSTDLVGELRTQYGEAILSLLRKITRATGSISESAAAKLKLQWPRLFMPTPAEMAQLIPALRDAVTPIVDPTTVPVRPAGGGSRPTSTVDPPTSSPTPVKTIGQLMELEKAQLFITQALDLEMLEDEDEETDEADDAGPTNEVAADAPPALPPDPLPDPDEDQNAAATDPSQGAGPVSGGVRDAFSMNVGPPVDIDV
jgi:hypothetical protein